MRFFKHFYLLLIILLPLVSSCGNVEEIVIGEPKEVKVHGFEDNYLVIDVALPVDNPTLHKISIREMDVRVSLNGRYLGKLIVDERLVLKPKSNTVYQIPVKIRMANILETAFLMMNLKKGQTSELNFEGEVKARTLFFLKTVEINETRKVNF
ncbi:MAG: LEA type 2 family protein [Bacteroidales bacterium]|nr:LEA type 2 family protein [Bacteroidales bacterium]